MKHVLILCLLLVSGTSVVAKLPAPSPETKAKAQEAAAKAAWAGKVDNFQLCQSQDRVAEKYRTAARKEGKDLGATVATPACVDPGPFVYAPPAPAAAPVDVKKG